MINFEKKLFSTCLAFQYQQTLEKSPLLKNTDEKLNIKFTRKLYRKFRWYFSVIIKENPPMDSDRYHRFRDILLVYTNQMQRLSINHQTKQLPH